MIPTTSAAYMVSRLFIRCLYTSISYAAQACLISPQVAKTDYPAKALCNSPHNILPNARVGYLNTKRILLSETAQTQSTTWDDLFDNSETQNYGKLGLRLGKNNNTALGPVAKPPASETTHCYWTQISAFSFQQTWGLLFGFCRQQHNFIR